MSTFDEMKDLDLQFPGVGRRSRIVKEDGLVKMKREFHVGNAVETVKKMSQQARHNGITGSGETRVAAILHVGQLQQIADKHGITVMQLISDKNYEDLLWAEGTGRDYSQMQIHKS